MDGEQASPAWRKSRRSASGNCVEVCVGPGTVGMRSSRQPDVRLAFDRASFADFLSAVKRGEFDRR